MRLTLLDPPACASQSRMQQSAGIGAQRPVSVEPAARARASASNSVGRFCRVRKQDTIGVVCQQKIARAISARRQKIAAAGRAVVSASHFCARAFGCVQMGAGKHWVCRLLSKADQKIVTSKWLRHWSRQRNGRVLRATMKKKGPRGRKRKKQQAPESSSAW